MQAPRIRRGLIPLGVIGLAYAPLLIILIRERWRVPHSQFTPGLLAAAAALVWVRRDLEVARSGPAPRLAAGLLGAAAALLAVGVLLYSPWFSITSLPLALLGLATAYDGRAAIERVGPVALLLACAIPLPLGLDQGLIGALQRVTSRVSSAVLDLASVPHLMAGNVLEFPEKRLLVEEACSGVQSLFALVAAVATYLVWRRRPWSIAVVLLPAAVGAAVLMNVARVTTIALAHHGFARDLSTGWPHEALGTATFALALGLLAAFEAVAGCLLGPIALPRFPKFGEILSDGDLDGLFGKGRFLSRPGFRAIEAARRLCQRWNHTIAGVPRDRPADRPTLATEAAEGTPPSRTETSGRDRGVRFAPVPLGIFGVLAVVQLPMALALGQSLAIQPVSQRTSRAIAGWDEATLPTAVRNWRQSGFERVRRHISSEFGEHSTVWRYDAEGLDVMVSCDYPFNGWHELANCYRNAGWTITARDIVAAPGSADVPDAPFVSVTMSRPTGETGLLCFSLIDARGQPVPIPETMVTPLGPGQAPFAVLSKRIRDRWLQAATFDASAGLTYQIQAFVTAPGPLPTTAQVELQPSFLALRAVLIDRLAEGVSSDPPPSDPTLMTLLQGSLTRLRP